MSDTNLFLSILAGSLGFATAATTLLWVVWVAYVKHLRAKAPLLTKATERLVVARNLHNTIVLKGLGYHVETCEWAANGEANRASYVNPPVTKEVVRQIGYRH